MKLRDWLDSRTGYRRILHETLYEPIPGGPRWKYVWGSTLVFTFMLQLVTGVLLMTVYSPSATTAWSSVWYIQTEMGLGWLIRGMHHFGSQAMIILLPLHVLQVVLARAYRAPREFNWWIGLGLLGVVLGLSLTGYLLPWDQKGYWATKVATNIMGLTPLVGSHLQRLVVGGSEYGHLTLTRFFTLHVMVLPGALILLLVAHLALFRKHGVTYSPRHANLPEGTFWPEQVLRDAIACLVVLVGIVGAACYMHFVKGDAMLDAPADPTASNYPARPEWYFLFLFQLLKYFEGPTLEVVGAIGVPAAVMLVLFLLPLLDKVLWRWLAHGIAVTFTLALFGGAGYLTWEALQADRDPPEELVQRIHIKHEAGESLTHEEDAILRARQFNDQRREATIVARRALELATTQGIPPSGPLELLANDPLTQGPRLFAEHCASCHRINGHNGLGIVPREPATSSDLAGFATRTWIRRLLEKPMSHDNFGLMKKPDGDPAHTRMAAWLESQLEENEDPADRKTLLANFDSVAAYLEDESHRPGRLEHVSGDAAASTAPADDTTATQPGGAAKPTDATASGAEALIRRGRAYFMAACNECHSYNGERTGTVRAPEMRGYGSVEWIERFIADPSAEEFYRNTGREPAQMPAFRDKLTPRQRELLAEWLRTTSIEAGRGKK